MHPQTPKLQLGGSLVIYWVRPVDNQSQVGERCRLIEEEVLGSVDEREKIIYVSPQFCAICPYRDKGLCERPIWFPNMRYNEKEKIEETKKKALELAKRRVRK